MHTTAQINIPRAMVQMRSVIELLLPEFVLVGEAQMLLNLAEYTPSLFRFLGPNGLRSVAHCRIVLTGSRWVDGS